MQEIWLAKVVMFVPKIICAIAGAILALVLSGDIDQDGYIKINRGVIVRFAIAVFSSLFFGEWIIEYFDLHASIAAQGSIMILTAVFSLVIIGVLYQSIAVMRGKSFGAVVGEVSEAFRSIFKKG